MYGARPLDMAVPNGAIYLGLDGNDSQNGGLNSPVRTLQRALNLAPALGTVAVTSGFYEQGNCSQVWRRPVTVMAAPGEEVTFSGSRVVTDWAMYTDDVWTTHYPVSFNRTPVSGEQCTPEHPEAAWPERVWVNGVKLRQCPPYRTMLPGEFRYDSNTGHFYITEDPTDKVVRIGTLQIWLTGNQDNQTGNHPYLNVHGIRLQDFCSSPEQFAALRVYGRYSVVSDCEFVGISAAGTFNQLGAGMVLEHNSYFGCGQLGYHNYRAPEIEIAYCSIEYCNDALNSRIAVAGGGKSDGCEGVMHHHNRCIYNDGHDLWADTWSHGAKWWRNVILTRGDSAGIHSELVRDAVIAGNYVNGAVVGCLVSGGANVRVAHNTNENCGQPTRWQHDPRAQYPQIDVVFSNNNDQLPPATPIDDDIAELLELNINQRQNPPMGWFGPYAQEEEPVTISQDLLAATEAAVQYIMQLEQDLAQCQEDLTAAEATIVALEDQVNELSATIVALEAVAEQRDAIIVCQDNKINELTAKLETCDCPEARLTLAEAIEDWAGHDNTVMGWSAAPGTKAAFESFNTVVGAAGQSRRVFPSGEQDFETDYAAGRMVMTEVPISMSDQDAEAFAERVGTLPGSPPVVIAIGHEEEHQSKGNTPTGFKTQYDRLYPILDAVPNAYPGHVWMNSSVRGTNAYVGPDLEDFRQWLPSQGHYLGLDLYVQDTTNLPFASPEKQLERPLIIAGELELPIIYSEFSVAGTDLQRKDYLQALMLYLDGLIDIDVLMFHWFNSGIGNNAPTVYPPTTPVTKSWSIDRCSNAFPDTLTPACFAAWMA